MMSTLKRIKSLFKKKEIYEKEFDDIQSLKEKPDSYFERGKEVRVINNLNYVKYFQHIKGGWDEDMIQCLNKKCTICEIDVYDKLIRIRSSSNTKWWVNRAILQSIDKDEKGLTIFSAIEEGNLDLLNELIDDKNINLTDENGRTPINLACCLGKSEIIHSLLAFGADVNIPDKSGNLPISNCSLYDHLEIITILEENSQIKNVCTLEPDYKQTDYSNINKESINIHEKLPSNKSESFETNVCNLESNYKQKNNSNINKESSLPISLPELSKTIFISKPDLLKSNGNRTDLKKQSILANEEYFNPPKDDSIIDTELNLKFVTPSKRTSKKISCKKCLKSLANYVGDCGHCFCTSCLKSLSECSICYKKLGKNILKIYVP